MVDQSPDSLREAAPAYDDIEAKRARAGVAAALFGEPSEDHERPSVGRYEIRGRLGAGGMGVVYRAHDPDLDRPVAVKLLHHDASTDDKARARMLREARSLAKLSHPNVIAVYDVGTEDGQVFVAMELVAGLDLRRWLERKLDASWREILALFIAAGRGLEAAHDVALVHRDFKPENVLVGDDGRVRVLDFGLARIGHQVEGPTLEDRAGEVDGAGEPAEGPTRDRQLAALGARTGPTLDLGLMPTAAPVAATGGSLTETGTLMGTPLYMAPELYAGQAADARSDQFAFCASLYEGLYRQLPFGARDLQAHVRAVAAGAIVDPPADTAVPARVHELVARGLAAEPGARHRDMGGLLTALERALAEPPPTELPEPASPGRWLAIVGLVVVAAVGLVGLELFGGGDPRARAEARPPGEVEVERPADVDEAPPPAPRATTDTGAARVEARGSEGDEVPALGETGSAVEARATETGADASDAASTGPELRDWCHLHEDRYTLLLRARRRRGAFVHEGVCYSCRVERRRSRTRNFSPRDCAGYALCGRAGAEVCE